MEKRMNDGQMITAIGLMSGTSYDGIDAALLKTDGVSGFEPLKNSFLSMDYAPELRGEIKSVLGRADRQASDIAAVSAAITEGHADIVERLLEQAGMAREEIDVIGFHGQTIFHDPENGVTVQLGDGQKLADMVGIPVVYDFRSEDMRKGGQGAPLLPVYHRALAEKAGLDAPVAFLNMGGVGNLTFVGQGEDMIAFDTGPANALMDDVMRAAEGLPMDEGGKRAAQGAVDVAFIERVMADKYFELKVPKSLDRDYFNHYIQGIKGLSLNNKLSSLMQLSVEAVCAGLNHCPAMPKAIYVCGGGARNAEMMRRLAEYLPCPVLRVDDLGVDDLGAGDLGVDAEGVEAEGFAYMAVRHLKGLPYSFPGTTGVSAPCCGGILCKPQEAQRVYG